MCVQVYLSVVQNSKIPGSGGKEFKASASNSPARAGQCTSCEYPCNPLYSRRITTVTTRWREFELTFHAQRHGRQPSGSERSPGCGLGRRSAHEQQRMVQYTWHIPGMNHVVLMLYLSNSFSKRGTPTSPAYMPCHGLILVASEIDI